MFQDTATQQEKALLDALRTEAVQLTEADTTERNLIQQQAQDILLAVTTRAEQAGNPAAAKLNNVVETRELIDELWQQDQDSYRYAYAEAARHALSTRGLTVSLEVVESGGSEHHPDLEDLHSYAEKTTPQLSSVIDSCSTTTRSYRGEAWETRNQHGKNVPLNWRSSD